LDSLIKMQIPTKVKLRPHHIAFLAEGYGLPDAIRNFLGVNPIYGKNTAYKVADFSKALFDNPDTEIEVVEGPDSICELCINHSIDLGQCIWIEDGLPELDNKARSDFNIHEPSYLSRDLSKMKDYFERNKRLFHK